MIHNHLKLKGLLAVLAIFFAFALTAQVSPDAGKKLFRDNCASCHNKNMKSKMTGPALGGMQERWDDDEALYSWIRNSQALIADGNPMAIALFNEWKTPMTAFPEMTDDEIGSVVAYVNGVYDGTYGVKKGGPVVVETAVEEKSNTVWYWLLFGVLGLIALVLIKVIGNLDQIAAAKEGEVLEGKSILKTLSSSGIVSILVFALVILAGYTTVNNAMNLGRQQGYQPDQPIKFSHKTHAGINKIDCKFCHDGARRSKHSVIPATSTCMNCHKAIKTGSTYGTAELSKIYASIGFNPLEDKYIEDYDNKTEEEIRDIFTEWITEQYKEINEITILDEGDLEEINEQWDGIKSSLTNEQKKKIQGPIEWTRIHNLPDHVYFNHSQHVTVGKLECQTCHGAVEEMEIVKQESPLSMGWCINCHRQTEVQFMENDYYKDYAKFHEEMKNGTRDKVTVADVGGLECQKCHY